MNQSPGFYTCALALIDWKRPEGRFQPLKASRANFL